MGPDAVVHVIDDDDAVRESLTFLLKTTGLAVRTYENATAFLHDDPKTKSGCIVTDVRMPDISGIELLHRVRELHVGLPVIVITGHGDVPLAVEAMKAGVVDFLEKPFEEDSLLAAIRAALADSSRADEDHAERERIKQVLEGLSPREHEVLDGVVEGKLNKVIAHELGISPRTVEVYRANLMAKTGARSMSELMRIALAAGL